MDPHSSHVGVYGGKFGPADREAYYRNMLASGFTHRAALVNLTSSQAALAWKEPIGLLYIDGDHRYEAVRADINAWSAFLVAGGVVVFIDASDRKGGPHRVVEDLTASGGFQSLRTVGAMHALKKL